MKMRVALIAALAVLGLLAAAGVTVAAGEIVSRPIGLQGSPDDLGRSLTPVSKPSASEKRTTEETVQDGSGETPAPSGGDDHDDDSDHESDDDRDDESDHDSDHDEGDHEEDDD